MRHPYISRNTHEYNQPKLPLPVRERQTLQTLLWGIRQH